MRLLRDTSGTYDQAKDSVQRDFVTLQRTIDQMVATEAALRKDISAIQAQLANPNISVAANGAIGGLESQKVVHDGSLFGFGTAASPLGAVAIAPAPTGLGDLLRVSLTVSDAQLRSLNTTPLTILAAPGAQKTIIGFYWTAITNVTSGFSDNAVLNFRYPDTTASGFANFTLGLTTTGTRISLNGPNSGQFNSTANTENKAFELFSNANRTGGTTHGGTVISLYYFVLTYL